jgi:[NiFe] hydrogenase assembly HybE family chaperone
MQEIREKLEAVFGEIEKNRMQNVPMCNPALQVKAIGFREWGDYYFGVMLTPWFMNLMLIPRAASQHDHPVPGSKTVHVFPSGCYEFVHAEEEALGHYQVCSLFSPVFEFADQQIAIDTAARVLSDIMDKQNTDNNPTIEEHKQTPLSRRQFLRAMLPRSEEQANGDRNGNCNGN